MAIQGTPHVRAAFGPFVKRDPYNSALAETAAGLWQPKTDTIDSSINNVDEKTKLISKK